MNIFTTFLIILLVVCFTDEQLDMENSWCVDKSWTTSDVVERHIRIADVPLGSDITFQCSFCGENDKGEPKLWYQSDRFTGLRRKEVITGILDVLESNRVYVTPTNHLVVRNLTINDTGQYSCVDLHKGKDGVDEINFALDLLPPNTTAVVSASSASQWNDYETRYLKMPRQKYANQSIKLEPEWLPWGPCDGCTGLRYRRAGCRVQFSNNTRIACRAIDLFKISSELAFSLSSIPDFFLSESCYAYCYSNRRRAPMYRNTFVLSEGSSLTLKCAGATADDKVTWRKDGLLLDESPNSKVVNGVLLDIFGTLYLIRITVDDSGNYTCFINDNRTQEVLVSVKKRNLMSTYDYDRHLSYLYYMFGLYFVLFSARIIYAFLNRHEYLEITEKDFEKPIITSAFLNRRIRIQL